MHGILMAINFHPLGYHVSLIFKPREAARIARPHIPFGGPFGHPFGQHFARPARLANTKSKDASFKRIGHARHWADQGIAVGRIGNGAVDSFGQRSGFQKWHPRHCIGDVPFQPIQIIREKLKAEVFGERIVFRNPMRFAVALIGP